MHPDFERVFENMPEVANAFNIADFNSLPTHGWVVSNGITCFIKPYFGRVMVKAWNSPNARDAIQADLDTTVVTL